MGDSVTSYKIPHVWQSEQYSSFAVYWLLPHHYTSAVRLKVLEQCFILLLHWFQVQRLGLLFSGELGKLCGFIEKLKFLFLLFILFIMKNKSRLIFVTACTIVTFTIFSLYAFVLVPVVLPEKERVKLPPIGLMGESFQGREMLKILFLQEDYWVFEKTQMVEFSDGAGVVLFKELDENLNGSEIMGVNQIRVSPCVVLCFPSNHEELSPQEKYRQAIVLEAANYALLEVEGAFGFSSTPQIKSGQLNGVVTIRSQMKNPDTSDNIELITSDVLFDYNQIRTSQRVDFKFGPNSGHGQGLTIQLANTDESKKGVMPNTVKRIELQQLGALLMYVESDKLNTSARLMPRRHVVAYPQATSQGNMFQLRSESPGSTEMTTRPSGTSPSPQSSLKPSSSITSGMSEVRVSCTGTVDMVADSGTAGQWLLTFRNQVNVLRVNPQGASDQLNCNELIVTFGQKEGSQKPNSSNNPLADFGSLAPIQVRAIGTAGSQVIVRSPENKGFQATGRDMVLDLVRKELALTQGDKVTVLYDQFKIEGKSIYYAYEGDDGLGKLDMPGGGTLEGTTGTDASKHIKLTWSEGLKVLPDQTNPNLTQVQINGKPKAEIDGIGTASGDEIRIWCDTSKKTPTGTGAASSIAAPGGNVNVDLKTILMTKNVILKTDNGEILTNKLIITFQPPNTTAQATRSVSRYPGPQIRNQATTNASKGKMSQMSFFGADANGNKSTYTVRADEVEVMASIVGKDTVVDQILLTKNVKLDEKMSVSGEEAMHLTGQKVRIDKPDTEQMTVRIEGDPSISGGHAVFQGRGIMLLGTNITVDRASNLFYVIGRGRLCISQQVIGSATAKGESGSFNKLFASSGSTNTANQSVIIEWAESMKFDGKELLFLKDVDINYSMMAVNKSDSVAVYLSKPFRFFENDKTNDIEPERVVIRGNIELERDTFAENNGGQLTHERIRLTAVELFPITGAFKGLGPGYISAIFLDNGDKSSSLLSSGTSTLRSTPTTTSTTNTTEASGLFGKGLKFMQCNFHHSVEGNYRTGQVAFYDRVVTMLCPAQSFRDVINTNNPRNIVANGMLLECNKLEITQPQLRSDSKNIDLKAEGNTRIEMTYDSRYYIANANKIKFEQGKNLFTMEGNQYTKVELYEGANLNAPTTKLGGGERIYFNPVTKEFRGDDLTMQTLIP